MTDTEPAEEILPRILRQYTERPRGWRVMHTPTGEMLVLGPESAFQFKLIPLNPFEVTGVGVEVSDIDKTLEQLHSTPEFGIRPLMESDIRSLLEAIGTPDLMKPKIDQIIRREPISPLEIESSRASHLLSGPVLTRPELGSLGPRTLELQGMLEQSATRLFRQRYPMRSGMYF